jgi:ubiquinone/menaquinone biosynthesis C-methylase UbiE
LLLSDRCITRVLRSAVSLVEYDRVMAREDYRSASYEIWQAMAAGWDRERSWMWEVSRAVSEQMLKALAPEPGQTILELAAGTGETGFAAARAIGPDGRLICTDFAPEMVAAARRESERLGLANVEHREMDAERMDLADSSVDGVLCRWGYMLMADPGAALRETRRVLRPGGRVALAAWTGPDDNRWSSVVGDVLVGRGLVERPPPGTPGQFAWAAPGTIEAQLEEAGFVDDVEVTTVDFDVRQTFEEWWERTLEMSQQVRAVLGLPGDEQAAIRDELRSRLERYADGDGTLAIPARSWVAAASA